jgi:hypothetical protein
MKMIGESDYPLVNIQKTHINGFTGGVSHVELEILVG